MNSEETQGRHYEIPECFEALINVEYTTTMIHVVTCGRDESDPKTVSYDKTIDIAND
jgi:hypothetical protein